MPALAGEPWRGLAKVSLATTATGLGRHWTVSVDDVVPASATGDQATWDFEGDTVAVTLRAEWSADVGTVTSAATTLNIQVRQPGGALATGSTWTIAAPGDTGSQTRTLHFDLDPLNQVLDVAGNRRWGMLELYLQVIVDPGGTTNDFTGDSRGTVTIQPALTTFSWARGYIRQKVTLSSLAISNVSLGGAEPASWAYPDPIHTRWVTTTPPYESGGSGNVSIRRPQAQGGAAERSDTTGTITSATIDESFTGVDSSGPLDNAVGIGITLASEAKDIELTLPTSDFGGDNRYAWATSGQPAGFSVPSAQTLRYVGRLTVDPRITFTHLFQLNDPIYGTPPLSKNVSPATRLSTDFGFIGERATNARSEGLNGVTWTRKLWDDAELSGNESSPTVTGSTTSANAGGQAGWSGSLMSWSSQIPGGTWQKKVVITSPGNATTLEAGATTTHTLISTDPRIVLNMAAGDPTTPGTHWRPGQPLTIGLRLFLEFTPVACDASTGLVSILRFNAATGRLQYLASLSPSVWTDITNGVAITSYSMAPSPGDADIQIRTFSGAETADFTTTDVFIIGQLKRGGAPYQAFFELDVVGSFFRHDIAATAGSILESAILFDGTSGHSHVGGTTGVAIGDRS